MKVSSIDLLVATILGLLFLVSSQALAQKDTSKVQSQQYSVKLDSTNVKSTDGRVTTKWYESSSMPWITSAIVAIASIIVNIAISQYMRRNSINLVKEQIKSSHNLATFQFQSTLNSKNRQDWIIETRNCTSEFLTQSYLLNIQVQQPDRDTSRETNLLEKIVFQKTKLEMLFNPSVKGHSQFITTLNEVHFLLEIHVLNRGANDRDSGMRLRFNNQDFLNMSHKLRDVGRELLYAEWRKIQEVKAQTPQEL